MRKLLLTLPFIFLLSACGDEPNKALNTTWDCDGKFGILDVTIKKDGNGYIGTFTENSSFGGNNKKQENVAVLNSDGSFMIGNGLDSHTVKYMEDEKNLLLTDGIGRSTRCNAVASQ